MIRYLTAKEILVLHALIVERTNGSHGVRDPKLLESIAHRPQARFGGKDVHNDLFAKAAALGEALVNYYVFVDGNKRTAFIAMTQFLFLNGFTIRAAQEEVERTMILVAKKEMGVEDLRDWIGKFVQEN